MHRRAKKPLQTQTKEETGKHLRVEFCSYKALT